MVYLEKEINNIIKEKIPILNQKDIDSFLNITTYKKICNKDNILESGKLSNRVFYILKGNIRGYIINDSGFELNIWIRSEGVFIGDTKSIFNQESQRFNYKAVDDTHILLFDYRKFETLAFEHPNIMRLYLSVLKESIDILSYRIETMITMTPKERYLDLLRLNPSFLNKAFDKHIANFLGITNVSLSRIIKKVNKTKS